MASTKEIKRRIKSVKNTKKITKAMELVAASKMKRAVSATLSSRPYASYSFEILQSLSGAKTEALHPLLEEREVKRVLVILITSNRGLCGAYNAQIIRRTMELIKEDKAQGKEIFFITAGKKGDSAMRRLGQNIVASFLELPDVISLRDIMPIANLAMEMYKNKEVDRVVVAYTDFFSALLQKPRIRALLPVSKKDIEKTLEMESIPSRPLGTPPKLARLPARSAGGLDGQGGEGGSVQYIFEPGYEVLMPILIEKLCRVQMLHTLLESVASEQSARMVAMKNASEAAGEMIEDLTLVFNKARQAGITQEISEISADMASVS